MANVSQPEVPAPWALQALGSRAGTLPAPTQDPSSIPAIPGYLELPQVLLELPGDEEIRKCWSCRCERAKDADPLAAGSPPNSCTTAHFSCSQASIEPMANPPAWAEPRETDLHPKEGVSPVVHREYSFLGTEHHTRAQQESHPTLTLWHQRGSALGVQNKSILASPADATTCHWHWHGVTPLSSSPCP